MGYFDDDEIANFTVQLKNSTQLCFILDGFDEYPDTRKERSFFIDLIYGGVFPNAIVVITSRPDCTLKLHDQMDKKIEILGLAREDRDQFISQSLCNEDKKIKLEKYLKNQPIINGFCYVPLYLAILLYLFQQDFLPENLTEVNKHFILHTVYRHMNALKQISSKVVMKIEELTPFYPDFMNKLSKLAFNGLENDKLIFSTDDLGFCITNETQNGFGLLQVVEHYPAVGAGNTTSFNFIHFTIQEYLAACYVSTLPHREQLDKMKETFWKHRYSFMWMMYVGIVGINSTVFIEFISKGEMYKNGSGPKILTTIQRDKRKRLQLFQCYMEAKCAKIMPRTISSMFANGEVKFTNITLLPHHVSYLTSFMSISVMQWTTLDLASSKLDDAAMNILEQFVVDYTQNASSFKCVDVSENPSSPWSVYCAIISCCRVSKLVLFGDNKHRMEPYMTVLRNSLQNNCNLQELSLFGISDEDLLSIKEFLLCCDHLLHVLNLSWKKSADKVIVQTSYNVKSEMRPTDERTIIRILDDESYGTLESKVMSSCNIGDKEIIFVSLGLHHNKTLRDLDISENNISASGAVALSNALKENDKLQSLDISKNNLTSYGARNILEAIQTTKTLPKLNVSEVGISEPDESIEKAISNMLIGNDTLYSLNLSKTAISIEGSKIIAESFDANTALRVLDISQCNLCDDGAVTFSRCLQKNVLEELYIPGNKITDEGIKKIAMFIKQNTSLKMLDISDNQINSEGLSYLLRNAKENSDLKLQNLYANFNNVTKSGLMHIEECVKELFLKVDVSWNEIIVDKSLVAIKTVLSDNRIVTQIVKDMADVNYRITLVSSCLAENKCVKQLSLSKFGITVTGANELSKAIKENKMLQAIDISGNHLGDEAIPAITSMLIDTLQKLDVSENEISREGAKQLAVTLKFNTALQVLKISNNNLEDEGMMAILTSSSYIQNLDFSNTDLTESGGKAISKAIQFNTHITHLNLFHACLANKSRFHEPIFNVLEYNQTLQVLTLPWLDGDDPLKQKLKEINQKRKNQVCQLKCPCFRYAHAES